MIYNVQLLRALAAYLVVFVHLEPLLRPTGISTPQLSFGGGGVDLFFVISGFVMVYTTARGAHTPAVFLVNRIIRVVPLYWLMTIAVFCVALVLPAVLGATRASLIDLLKSLAFIPFAKGNGLVRPVLFLGRTLNYEMFFYAIFAASMAAKTSERRVLYAGSALVVLVVAGALFNPTAVPLAFLSKPIMLEFLFGMVLALAFLRGAVLPRAAAWLALAAGLAFLIGHRFFIADPVGLLFSGLPSTVILLGAISLEQHGLSYRGRLAQLLGAASYALYLSHPFVTVAIAKIAHKLGLVTLGPALLAAAFALVVVGAVAVVIHLLIERPMSRFLRGAIGHRPSVVERVEAQIV